MLPDLSVIDPKLDQLLSDRESRRFLIVGTVGTGRTTLANRLSQRLEGQAIRVMVPAEGLDRPLHLLAQAASGEPQEIPHLLSDSIPFVDRVRSLTETQRPLILVLSRRAQNQDDSAEAETLEVDSRQDLAIQTLWSEYRGRLFLFLEDVGTASNWDLKGAEPLRLDAIPINVSALEEASLWGPLAQYAGRLAARLGKARDFSPIGVRLAIGCLALGLPEESVLAWLSMPVQQDAIRYLALAARSRLQPKVLSAARALALCRSAVPRSFAQSLVDGLRHKEFWFCWFCECLGYGTDKVRLSNIVRQVFLRSDRERSIKARDCSQHSTLSRLYRSLDGANHPGQLQPAQVVPWLERLHHLANSPSEAPVQDEWLALMEACGSPREFLWERAKALSLQEEYRTAAELYSRCTSRDPKDSYSWHYLGFNLERSKRKDRGVEDAFARAVHLEPSNPRWNQRYIRFLIRRSKLREASRALHETETVFAKANVSFKLREFYQREFYQPIVARYLKNGYWEEALEILKSFPEQVRQSGLFTWAWQLARDQQENALLEESVYPAEYPMEARWQFPPELRSRLEEGAPWYPGRVVRADAQEVTLILATTEPEILARTIYERRLTAPQWESLTMVPSTQAQGYWFIGAQSSGGLVLERMDHQPCEPYRPRLFHRLRRPNRHK